MSTKWLEDLPESCPPSDAYASNETFYRLVSNNPPKISDFWSNRKIFPQTPFPDLDECLIKSCSIISTIEECKKRRKHSRFKDKRILKFYLNRDIGVIKKTFGRCHFSWWVSANLDINTLLYEFIDD